MSLVLGRRMESRRVFQSASCLFIFSYALSRVFGTICWYAQHEPGRCYEDEPRGGPCASLSEQIEQAAGGLAASPPPEGPINSIHANQTRSQEKRIFVHSIVSRALRQPSKKGHCQGRSILMRLTRDISKTWIPRWCLMFQTSTTTISAMRPPRSAFPSSSCEYSDSAR